MHIEYRQGPTRKDILASGKKYGNMALPGLGTLFFTEFKDERNMFRPQVMRGGQVVLGLYTTVMMAMGEHAADQGMTLLDHPLYAATLLMGGALAVAYLRMEKHNKRQGLVNIVEDEIDRALNA